MRSNENLRFAVAAGTTALICAVAAAGCSKGSTQATGGFPAGSGSLNPTCNASSTFNRPANSGGANLLSVSVAGSQCAAASGPGGTTQNYPNEICATVTICTPGCDNQCQTISDVLLDTGSYGLRIFSSALTIPLTQVASGQSAVAECVGFGDSSSEWGPVELADIMLAGEPVIPNVPILVINSTYATPPDACSSNNSFPDSSPQEAGFNGILGVGVFGQDCGPDCTSDADNGYYYACQNGLGCGGTTVLATQEITNPVSLLPVDNNGVIMELPAIADTGAPSVDSGFMLIGIDTETNNPSTGMTYLSADGYATFRTLYNGQTTKAFIDSGSSDLAFTAPIGTSDCSQYDTAQYFGTGSGASGDEFYCPSSPLSQSATQLGVGTGQSSAVTFSLYSAFDLLFQNGSRGSNSAFATIGGPAGGDISGVFDWGLPFFFGKNVAVGIDGTTSNLGSGPYWGY